MGRHHTHYIGCEHVPIEVEPITAETMAKVMQLLPQKAVRARYKNHLGTFPPPEIEWPRKNVFPETPLFQEIKELLDAKDTYERIPLDRVMPPTQYCLRFPEKFDHNCNLGNFSVTDRKCKKKWLTDIPYTPTEIATAYLYLCEIASGAQLTVKYSKFKDICKSRSTIFFSGRYQGELAYIDLKHAYWQILSPTTADMEYEPDVQSIVSHGHISYIRPDEFVDWKLVRNVLNTLYQYRIMSYWDKDKGYVSHQTRQSPFYRPYNYAYIMDVMNAVVTDCMNNFPICQWLTDAPIVPGKYADSIRDFLWNEWFLDSRLEAWGDGDSKNTNVYYIAPGHGLLGKKTLHYEYARASDRPHGIPLPAANIEGLKQERWEMLNETAPISPLVKSIHRVHGFKQMDIKNAVTYEIPQIRRRYSTERGKLLEIPENPITDWWK